MASEHQGTSPSHRPSVLGPVVLILFGLLLLLSNLGVIPFSLWELLLQLWPILLVAVGLDLLIGRRSRWGGWIVLVVTLALAGVSVWYMDKFGFGPGSAPGPFFQNPFWEPDYWW